MGKLTITNLRRPEWLVAVAMVALPFDTWKFGPAGLLSPSNVAFMCVAIAVVGLRRAHPGWTASERWAAAVAGMFVLSFLPGAIFAQERTEALRTYLSLVGMGGVFLLVILSTRDRISLAVVFHAWLLGGLIAASAAIVQYVLWLFGVQVGTAGIAGLCSTPFVTLRAEGFTASPNYLAFFVLPVAVAGVGLLPSRPPARWIGAVAAAACALTVFFAYSRGAIGALGLAACLGLCLFIFSHTRRLVPRVAAIGASLVLLALFARLLIGFNAAGAVSRQNIIFSSLRAIGSSPVSGTGLGSGVSIGADVSGFCDRVVVTRAEQSTTAAPTPSTASTATPAPVGAATSATTGPGGAGALVVATVLIPGLFFISAAAFLWRRRAARFPLIATGVVLVAVALFFIVAPRASGWLAGGLGGAPPAASITPSAPSPTIGVSVVAASSAPSTEVTTTDQAFAALGPSASQGPSIGRRDTHVTILQAAADAGAFGLFGYLSLVFGTLWYGTRSWSRRTALRSALVVSAIALQVAALVTDALSIKQLYVNLAFVWAVAAMEVGRRSKSA